MKKLLTGAIMFFGLTVITSAQTTTTNVKKSKPVSTTAISSTIKATKVSSVDTTTKTVPANTKNATEALTFSKHKHYKKH